jgi:hypothetical protein
LTPVVNMAPRHLLAVLATLLCSFEVSDGFVFAGTPLQARTLHAHQMCGQGCRMSAAEHSGGDAARRALRYQPVSVQAKASIAAATAPHTEDSYDNAEELAPAAPQQARETLVNPVTQHSHKSAQQAEPGSKGGVLVTLAFWGVVATGLYKGGQTYFARQEALVDEYALEAAECVDNWTQVESVHKRYKRKLGPGQFRQEMFAAFLLELARAKPITCSTLQAAERMRKKFRYGDMKVAKLLAAAGEQIGRKNPGLRSKVLFYADKLTAKTPAASKKHMEGIREQLSAGYRNGGQQVVATAQVAIAEQALRDSIEPGSNALPPGYELLGLDEARAKQILAEEEGSGGAGSGSGASTGESSRQDWKTFFVIDDEAKKLPDDEVRFCKNPVHFAMKCGLCSLA